MRNHTTIKGRIGYLDIARSIAIISITCNHAVNRSFAIYGDQYEEFNNIPMMLTIIKTMLYTFSRIGVPLFVMISGALLLPRDFSRGGGTRFLKKNCLQLFITTELWLIIMYWYRQLSSDSILMSDGLGACIARFFSTLGFINVFTMDSMWYMFMILCVYLMIPILSSALQNLEVKYFLLPMFLVFVSSFLLPDINGVLDAVGAGFTLEASLNTKNLFSMYIIYLLIGYFISQEYLVKIKSRTLLIAVAISYVGYCLFQFYFFSVPYTYVVGYNSIFPMMVSVPLFELFHRNYNFKLQGIATKLSKMSFGIYFLHICIMDGLASIRNHMGLDISYLWRFLILEFVSFFGSILIILSLKRNRWIALHLFGIKE